MKHKNGNFHAISDALQDIRKGKMVSLATEFGMTPSARTRIHAEPPDPNKKRGFFDAS